VGDDHDAFDDDDAEPLGSPPHPLDRVWRHPSELPAEPPRPRAGGGVRRELGRLWLALAAAGTGAIATLVILAAFGVFDDGAPAAPESQRARSVAVNDAGVAKLAADLAPSIVAVSVIAPDGSRRGSGVCVSHDGDILTSDRLVRGATQVRVTTHTGVTRVATVKGHDPATDLALLHVGTSVQAAPVASAPLKAGETVLAIGASGSGGTEPWIGQGIVASTDGAVAQLGGPAMDGLIATDAWPGKAGWGGALLDRQGTVAGIVVGPVMGDDSTYAVPIGFAAEVANELGEHGSASHGWIGAQSNDPTGAPIVSSLDENGPAARAGMKVGDRIVEVGGRTVLTMGDVTAAVRWYDPRRNVVLKVERNGQIVNIEVTMGETPAPAMLVGA
jgi:S1-C subfamily serine protease